MSDPSDLAATPIAVAVVEHAGRFLVGWRPEGVPLAGLAEFPGGKVLPGETPEQAAARECLEETGMAIEVGPTYPRVIYDYAHGRVDLHFFACTPLDSSQSPRPPFRWVDVAGLAALKFPAANADLIANLVGLQIQSSCGPPALH